MSGARLWIVLAAVVSFLAGTAAGVLWARSEDVEPTSGWAAYAERVAGEFDLEPERRSGLRIVLDQYATEVANMRRAYEARILNQIEPELGELGARYEAHFRDAVLPPGRRAEYDRLSEPQDFVAAP